MLVISCHADTCGTAHRCEVRGHSYYGHMDNFSGVHAVMGAFFSGRLRHDHVRIELTHGEEEDMEGARQVRRTLKKRDVVVVVDVTGTPTHKALVIEKCRDESLRAFLAKALDGVPFDLYEGCPDPIADEDEVDVYVKRIRRVFLLGIPCTGGDYNEEEVFCRKRSIAAATEAWSRTRDTGSEPRLVFLRGRRPGPAVPGETPSTAGTPHRPRRVPALPRRGRCARSRPPRPGCQHSS